MRATPSALPVAALTTGSVLSVFWENDGVRAGAAFAFGSPDRWLALIGLGLVLGTSEHRGSRTASAALVGGAALAAALQHSASWTWITGPRVFAYLHLLGPGACLLAGLLLVMTGRWRSRTLPVVAIAVAASLVLTAAVNDPAPESLAFVTGTSLALFGIVLAAASLRRTVTGTWTPIAERIGGSWLLTIGLLLATVQLVPGPAPFVEPERPAAEAASRPRAIPDFEPAVRPDADAFSNPLGDRGLPKGTN